MEIEKIKNYNQRMLAVLFTLLVFAASIGLLAFITILGIEIFSGTGNNDNALLSDSKIDELNENNQRLQILDFGTPLLADSIKSVYVIPVGVKTLDEPEEAIRGLLDVNNSNLESRENASFKYSRSVHYGSFTNLLLYHHLQKRVEYIIDERISGQELNLHYFPDETIITFSAANNDSNKNGVVNEDDRQSLYIYSLKDRKLIKLEDKIATVVTYEFINRSKDILVTFLQDRDMNNKFEPSAEPSFIKLYNNASGKFEPLVKAKLMDEIQAIIDKKK